MKRFSQLGGLQLDRDIRALVAYAGELTQRPVRDEFAALTQVGVAAVTGACELQCKRAREAVACGLLM